MDKTTRAGSSLRQRMIEDMRMRKLEPRIRPCKGPSGPGERRLCGDEIRMVDVASGSAAARRAEEELSFGPARTMPIGDRMALRWARATSTAADLCQLYR